jgi:diguanylate cyclase (GGDEF)-like protein
MSIMGGQKDMRKRGLLLSAALSATALPAASGGSLLPALLILIVVLIGLLVWAVLDRSRLKAELDRKLEAADRELQEQRGRLIEAQKRMEELARTDDLTGLPNRHDMLERLDEERIRFERNRRPFAVVMADLDRFKVINDAYGQESGDYLLKACASLLRLSLRKQDRVGRWGGDDFLLILPGTDETGGRKIVETIRKRVAETPFGYGGRSFKTGLSFGMCVFRGGLTVDGCIREASEALAADRKKRGRAP